MDTPTQSTLGRLRRDDRGQVMVIAALLSMVFVFFWLAVFGVGEAVGDRMKLQDTADAVSYSQALAGARALNWLAYTNRAKIANTIILTQFQIIHSHSKFWFDLGALFQLIADLLSWVPVLGGILQGIATVTSLLVVAYEKLGYYLSMIGVPVQANVIMLIHYLQYFWLGMMALFPMDGNKVFERIDKPLHDTKGSIGLGQLTDLFKDGGSDPNYVAPGVKLALTAWSYYQYYQLIGLSPHEMAEDSTFNPDLKVWKRFKWVSEETARDDDWGANHFGFLYPWSWTRGPGKVTILDVKVAKISFNIGGETHIERYSKGRVASSGWGGDVETMQVGPLQWDYAMFGGGDGWRKLDSYAHDFFTIQIEIWKFWKFWDDDYFTVFEKGIHELDISSGLYDEEEEGSNDSGGFDTEEQKKQAQDSIDEGKKQVKDGNKLLLEAAQLRLDADALRAAALLEPDEDKKAQMNADAAALDEQADTKEAQGEALIKEGEDNIEAGTNGLNQANDLDDLVGDIASGIGGALYHDAPVKFWWYYLKQSDDRSVDENRWKDLLGHIGPQPMWEVDSSVQDDGPDDYKWTIDRRSIFHYVYLDKDYQFPLNDFGMAELMYRPEMTFSGSIPGFGAGGYMALSRAEVFYLNPSRKHEWPNVWSPYWKPRLGAVSKDLSELIGKVPLLDKFSEDIAGAIIQH